MLTDRNTMIIERNIVSLYQQDLSMHEHTCHGHCSYESYSSGLGTSLISSYSYTIDCYLSSVTTICICSPVSFNFFTFRVLSISPRTSRRLVRGGLDKKPTRALWLRNIRSMIFWDRYMVTFPMVQPTPLNGWIKILPGYTYWKCMDSVIKLDSWQGEGRDARLRLCSIVR